MTHTKDEALKLALDDLIAEYHMETSSFAKRVNEIFKQALAAPVQPVPWSQALESVWAEPDDTPPAAQPAVQEPVARVSLQWLAEMILSDCGHSSNYTPLLDRVKARIEQWERANSAPTPPAAPVPLAEMAQILCDRLAKEQAVYLSMETAKSLVKSMLAAAPEKGQP
jgi:hypothetical protein